MADEIIQHRDAGVLRVTLNRPQKANALSAALVEALLATIAQAGTDGTRLLVLDGAGAHFCAGFDFTGFEENTDGDLALRFVRIETLLQALYYAPFETVAFAHGSALGAGADIVAACSVRVAAPPTKFRMPGLRFGVVLGTQRLAHRIGTDAARDVLSTARTFTEEEGLRLGFLTQVAPQEAWPGIVGALTERAAALSPAAAAALHQRTLPDTRDEDMAALARSVSAPGLKERIRMFRGTR